MSLPDPRAIVHPYPFDPTGGCSPAALRAIAPPPAPAGFADFWRATRAEADGVPLALDRGPAIPLADGWRRHPVRFTVLGGVRCGAWLLLPPERPRAGLVAGHGYGCFGPDSEAVDPGHRLPFPAAYLHPCAPGFPPSLHPGLPDTPAAHVVHGIASRDTYVLRACVAALWGATRALAELVPAVADRLGYAGVSFGGGLGALALPWEPAWRCARLVVPTFGHHPWRLRCPCVGSGEAVREHHRTQPAVTAVLAYYDAATAATCARVPVQCEPAFFDPAVPPPGQWAVANALPRGEILPTLSGHFDGPWSQREEMICRRAWQRLAERVLLA